MKRFSIQTLVFLGILLVAPAWSHHAAEGIVSDDIWQMIDGLLEEADSPHLSIDFDDVMDSMGVVTAAGGGEYCAGNNDCGDRLLLVTSIVVPTIYVDDYMIYIDFAVADRNRVPAGKTSSGTALKLQVVIEDLADGLTEISLYEPIGAGRSQVGFTPTPKQGK
ncbi:MAG TPA: hypothetical protein VIS57_07120 [Xanthomonadales bacterium]